MVKKYLLVVSFVFSSLCYYLNFYPCLVTLPSPFLILLRALLVSRKMSSLSLADIPVQAPPPGIVPNFVNPVTRAPIVVRVEAVCLALDWIAFSLRMYSRVKISRSWAWDDGRPTTLGSRPVSAC